jgi:single-strand DNA-binding protein
MIDTLSVSGIVATTPRHVVTSEGLAITSFRLASTQRRFDKGQAQWVDIDTNWYTVVSFRQLAINANKSLNKGDRVVATGRVKVRNWQNDDKSGTSVEIEADALGHDLLWGTSAFERTSPSRDLDDHSEGDEEPF